MPIVPLFGHDALRARLSAQVERGALPASLLLHGPAGIGKQRLALWLAQRLLCEAPTAPCGDCQHCRLVDGLQHPDVHWLFPHPTVTGGNDKDAEALRAVHDERVEERAAAQGLYARPDGSNGIFIYDTRYLLHWASRSKALARHRVIVVGDAERMVSQAASAEAANAFLKLLEEPPPNTTILLTSSEPGALLPTIRSRVVGVRVAPLRAAEVRAFVEHPAVREAVAAVALPELLRAAGGAPGALLGGDERRAALSRAQILLQAVDGGAELRFRTAFSSGTGKARGAFSDVLDSLTVLLHARAREAAERGDASSARHAARAIPVVEAAKRAAEGNANPQLVTAHLLERIAEARR